MYLENQIVQSNYNIYTNIHVSLAKLALYQFSGRWEIPSAASGGFLRKWVMESSHPSGVGREGGILLHQDKSQPIFMINIVIYTFPLII
jgi:hypothetical protein